MDNNTHTQNLLKKDLQKGEKKQQNAALDLESGKQIEQRTYERLEASSGCQGISKTWTELNAAAGDRAGFSGGFIVQMERRDI